MIQEIITYIILGLAVTLAIIKLNHRFWRKKSNKSKMNYDGKNPQPLSNCFGCVAECVMRNSFQITNSSDLCDKTEANSN